MAGLFRHEAVVIKRWRPTHNKPLVCVTWEDAESSAPNEAFYEEEIVHKTRPMETYGLLLKDDDKGITVMTEFYQEDDGKHVFRGKTLIPRPLIVKVETLLKPQVSRLRKLKIKPDSLPPS